MCNTNRALVTILLQTVRQDRLLVENNDRFPVILFPEIIFRYGLIRKTIAMPLKVIKVSSVYEETLTQFTMCIFWCDMLWILEKKLEYACLCLLQTKFS